MYIIWVRADGEAAAAAGAGVRGVELLPRRGRAAVGGGSRRGAGRPGGQQRRLVQVLAGPAQRLVQVLAGPAQAGAQEGQDEGGG